MANEHECGALVEWSDRWLFISHCGGLVWSQSSSFGFCGGWSGTERVSVLI
jgi:hypothetical protein